MRNLLVVAALAAGLCACGSSNKQATTSNGLSSTTASTTATTSQPAPPKGKLTSAEYKAMVAATKRLDPLHNPKNLRRAIHKARPACAELTVPTELIRAEHAACGQVFRVLTALEALESRNAECTQAARAGDISCFSDLFRTIGRSSRVANLRDAAVSAATRRRGLKGACAKELATSSSDRRQTAAITHDALSAAHALEARDQAAFQRASARLKTDLQTIGSGGGSESPKQSLRRLATCPR